MGSCPVTKVATGHDPIPVGNGNGNACDESLGGAGKRSGCSGGSSVSSASAVTKVATGHDPIPVEEASTTTAASCSIWAASSLSLPALKSLSSAAETFLFASPAVGARVFAAAEAAGASGMAEAALAARVRSIKSQSAASSLRSLLYARGRKKGCSGG